MAQKANEILLSKAAQDASARTHSLGLNMPLACLPIPLHSPEWRSLLRPIAGRNPESPWVLGGIGERDMARKLCSAELHGMRSFEHMVWCLVCC